MVLLQCSVRMRMHCEKHVHVHVLYCVLCVLQCSNWPQSLCDVCPVPCHRGPGRLSFSRPDHPHLGHRRWYIVQCTCSCIHIVVITLTHTCIVHQGIDVQINPSSTKLRISLVQAYFLQLKFEGTTFLSVVSILLGSISTKLIKYSDNCSWLLKHTLYGLLTLGAHAQEGYGTCPVCLSVCLLPLNRRHRLFLRSN